MIYYQGNDLLPRVGNELVSTKNLLSSLSSIICNQAKLSIFFCNHKEFTYNYRQKIDNVAQLQIIDDKEDYRFFVDNVKNYQF